MEQIGEGGMGLVFVAEQQQPVRRKVALKVIKPGMDTRHVVARFEAERQALALMDHLNIARVLDGGQTAGDRPYFVMELVKGVPITDYCDRNQVSIRQRLELFVDVCQAVQHAHQKGIIHRDLKPSNVLVMSHDGTPVVKIIDFGVAKAIGQQLTDKTLYTQFSQLIGTPLYMSPEQAGQSGLDVDTRSDIYSLGVLLYELLTGTTPFDKELMRTVSYDEMRRIIREEEPPRPSTRISTLGQAVTTVSTQRQSDWKQLSRLFRGELDWIVMKALEKDRNRRYETANDLVMDVQRYLADEPVQAHPPSAGYRLRKLLRRHWINLVLALAALTVLVAVVALVGGALFIGQLRQEQDRAQTAAARLALQQGLSFCESGESGRGLIWLARCLELAPRSAEDMQQASRANLAVWLRPVHPLRAAFRQNRSVTSVAFHPNGRSILVAGSDRTARLYDAAKGEPVPGAPVLDHDEEVQDAVFSPDGRTIATAVEVGAKALLYRAEDGSVIRELGHGHPVRAVAFHPNGRIVATAGYDRHVRLWDSTTGCCLSPVLRHDRELRAVAFSHDGSWLLAGGADQKARVWQADTGRPVAVLPHSDEVWAIAGHPRERRLLATACGDGKARLWHVDTGRIVAEFAHREIVWDLAFSPDGRFLLTGSGGGTARVWEIDSGRPAGPPLTHRDAVRSVAFSPDGQTFATGSYDGSVRLWGLNIERLPSRELHHGGPIQAAAFSPEGRLVVTAGNDGTVRRWRTSSTAEVGQPLRHEGRVNALAFSPDGNTLLTGSYDHFARRWCVPTGKLIRPPMAHGHRVPTVAFRPDGQVFLTGSIDRTARLWNAATGQPIGGKMKHGAGVERAAFSPDGRWIVTTCQDKRVHVWDGESGRPLWDPVLHEAPVRALAISPDSKTLLIACDNGTPQLWDVSSARLVWTLPYRERVLALAFDRDGKRLVTGAADGTARIWDAATGSSLTVAPMVHQDRVLAVAFSPEGHVVVTGSEDRTARLWDARTGRPLGLMVRHQSKVSVATFSPDGRTILTASWDGTARLWEQPDALGGSVAQVVQTVQVLTGLEMSDNEVIRVMDVAEWHESRQSLERLGGSLWH
jgi:WD40 repeat protein/serine/threonine protein kinase